MKEIKLTERRLKNRNKFQVKASRYHYILMSVWVVMKCNFNDEMLIESRCFNVEDLIDKPIVWNDLYLGKSKNVGKKIAFSSLKGNKLSVFLIDGDEKKEYNLNGYDFFVDDKDEKTLITCKISLHEKKESWW